MLTAIKRQWIPKALSQVPMGWWHRLVGIELLLPHWHLANDAEVPHVSGLYQFRTVRQFREDIEFFLANYQPVSLEDIKQHLEGVRSLPRKCFFPTFDDGFREIHESIAPILTAKGVPAEFFLITSAIDNHTLCYPQKKSLLIRALAARPGSSAEKQAAQILARAGIRGAGVSAQIASIHYPQRAVLEELAVVAECDFAAYVRSAQPYLSREQVRGLMKDGFSIGAHSVNHPRYSDLPFADQLAQTRESMQWLSQEFGYTCDTFAFPYRDTKMTAQFFDEASKQTGLRVCFTMDSLCHSHHPRNLVRFSMERSALPAAQIVVRQYAKALLKIDS